MSPIFPDAKVTHPRTYADRQRDGDVLRHRAGRASARDVEIPEPRNPNRRDKCAADSLQWLRTYLPGIFYKPFDRDQKAYIADVTACLTGGGLKAIVAPRGGGKSSILKGLKLWATLNGHVRYAPIIGKNATEGLRRLDEIKMLLTTAELLGEDYPEVCAPVRALKGVHQRARTMTHGGAPLHFEWGGTHVVLPYLPALPWCKCSSGVLHGAGLDGSIRGITYTTADGSTLRPDFFLLDDPQSQESARSGLQILKLLDLIHKDLLGLFGHGEQRAGAAIMTIIEAGDVADQLTRRDLYPQWNGDRYQLLYQLPGNLKLWDEYEEIVYRAIREDPATLSVHDCPRAREFYRAHREKMDRGAKLASQHLHLPRTGEPTELSSLQYIMDLRLEHGPAAFEAEYNGAPQSHAKTPLLVISAYTVRSSLGGYARGVVPAWAERLFVGVDVQKDRLVCVALAMAPRGRRGHVVDYGPLMLAPVTGDARQPGTPAHAALERAIRSALVGLRERLALTPYRDESGAPVPVDLAVVDAGFMRGAVNSACDESKRWISSMGYSRKELPKRTKECQVTQNLFRRLINGRWRHYHDADMHKWYVHEGFRLEPGHQGSLTLCGNRMVEHKDFAEQVCAEVYVEVGDNEYRWEVKPGNPPNHYLDATALAFVGGTYMRCTAFSDSMELVGTVPEGVSQEPEAGPAKPGATGFSSPLAAWPEDPASAAALAEQVAAGVPARRKSRIGRRRLVRRSRSKRRPAQIY